MRAVLIALSVCFAATSAHAQSELSFELAPSSRFDDARRLADAHHDAIVLRNTGIALAIIGTAITAAGSWETFNGALCDSCSAQMFSVGTGLVVAGQGVAVAGISMWAAGGIRAGRADGARVSGSAGGLKVAF